MPNLYACGLCVRPKPAKAGLGSRGWNKKPWGFSLVGSSLVKKVCNKKYMIKDGYTSYLIAKELGLKQVEVYIIE